MKGIQEFYQKHLENRFVIRLMLIYSVIIIAIISIMAWLISQNITDILKDQAVSHNMQVLETVDVYFYNQNKKLKKIIHGIYTKPLGQNIQAVSLIEQLFKKESEFSDTVNSTRILSEYLADYGLPTDTDISDILLVDKYGDYLSSSRQTSSFSNSTYHRQIASYIAEQHYNSADINIRKTYIITSTDIFHAVHTAHVYMICDYIRQPNNPSVALGNIAAIYNPAAIKNVYNQFSPYLLGEILIITDDNQIVFDSTDRYTRDISEIVNQLKRGDGIHQTSDFIINVVSNQEFGYKVIGLIPTSELGRNADRLNSLILVLTVFCIVLILTSSYLNNKWLSRWVDRINSTLTRLENGELTARVELPSTQDEIYQIASNLNNMSEKLQEHIELEYMAELSRANAELKQRTAELYALQAQINPHFLYNTLEAIRMQAIQSQATEAADMIKILAKLFRSSAKGDLAVSVQMELDYCKAYLSLLDIRYVGRLEVIYDIDPEIMKYAIVKHLLQPIIENAFLHGIDLTHSQNQIKISGRRSGEMLVFSIEDNGVGIEHEQLEILHKRLAASVEDEHGSIGVYNVQNRIKMIYGQDCGLEINSKIGIGSTVSVTVKALSREELLHNVQSFDRG